MENEAIQLLKDQIKRRKINLEGINKEIHTIKVNLGEYQQSWDIENKKIKNLENAIKSLKLKKKVRKK